MGIDGFPEDWRVMPLGTVLRREAIPVEVQPSAHYREIGIRSHGKGIFHKEAIRGASLGEKRVFEVVPGALAINIVFAWEGAVAIISDRERGMIASHRFPMYVPSGSVEVDVEFVRRFFQTKRGVDLLGDASPGGAGRNRTLNQKFVAEIPIPIPPIGEQRKIAAILSMVDNAIEATQAVVDQLQVVKKAMAAELLKRGLPGRHARFKQTEIGEVPENWQVVQLCQLVVAGPSNGRSPPARSLPPGVPTFSIAAVRDGRVNIRDHLKYTELNADEARRFALAPGDILIVRGNGNPDFVGKCGMVQDVPEGCIYPDILMRVRPSNALLPSLFVTIWNSDIIHDQLLERATTTNGTYKINGEHVRSIRLPVPDHDEQELLSNSFSAIDDSYLATAAKLNGLHELREALLAALLSGDLRVIPDEVRA
jgi:type I restriction enzyme, S subunit